MQVAEELDFVFHMQGQEIKTLTVKRNKPGVFYIRKQDGLAKLTLDEIQTDASKLVILRAGAQVIGMRHFPEHELQWMFKKERQILAELPRIQSPIDSQERVQF